MFWPYREIHSYSYELPKTNSKVTVFREIIYVPSNAEEDYEEYIEDY